MIAAIYWRQIDLDRSSRRRSSPTSSSRSASTSCGATSTAPIPPTRRSIRWGWWFAGLSFLAGACWGVAGYLLASKEYELQRMLLGLVLLATITTAVPIRSAHPPTFYAFAVATTRRRCCSCC